MKTLFYFGLILVLGLSCRADDEDEGEGGDMNTWMALQEEIKSQICISDKVDDKILDSLLECKSIIAEHLDKFEKFREIADKLYEECGVPNEGDVSKYTKVDMTNTEHKKLLMGYCSENMKSCMDEKFKEMINNPEYKKPEKSERPHLTNEQKEELKTCMKKAVE